MVEARAGTGAIAADARVRMVCAPFASADELLTCKPWVRPDLGIGMDYACLKGRSPTGIVHSLSSPAAPGGTLFLEGSSGRAVTSTKIAALAAPTDLQPGAARVRLTAPAGAAVETLRSCVAAGHDLHVTACNDVPMTAALACR